MNGFYRLIEHPADVTVENILAPHRERTGMRGQSTVLAMAPV